MKYELTLTLKGSIKSKTPPEQFNKTQPILLDILKGFQASMIAELHQDNDVHYHGLVELSDHKERNVLLNRIRKYHDFGRKTCSQVRWENSYEKYMKKDYDVTRDILERCPIVIDKFNIFKDFLCEIITPDELEELTEQEQIAYMLNNDPNLYYDEVTDSYYIKETCD